jgi:hypothetical protein
MIRHLLNAQTPDRWVDCDELKYPKGGNPWTDLYTEEACKQIAREVGIDNPDTTLRMRYQLAATAEHLTGVLGFVGGAATLAQKHKWAEKLDKACRKVMPQLEEATDNLSTVSIKDKDGKHRVYLKWSCFSGQDCGSAKMHHC